MRYKVLTHKIIKYYDKIKPDIYTEEDWRKDSKVIKKDIKEFEKNLQKMKEYVENNDINEETGQKFQNEINYSNKYEEMINEIKKKTKNYKVSNEYEDIDSNLKKNVDDDEEEEEQKNTDSKKEMIFEEIL